MPFKSEKQRKYLWANEPGIARDWTDKYGSRVKKQWGGITDLFGIPEQHMINWGDALATPKSKSKPWSTTPEYHQWGAQDLTEQKSKQLANIPYIGGVASRAFEAAAPYLALGASPIYDAAQAAFYKYPDDPGKYEVNNKWDKINAYFPDLQGTTVSGILNAIDMEDPLSAAYNRMIGAGKVGIESKINRQNQIQNLLKKGWGAIKNEFGGSAQAAEASMKGWEKEENDRKMRTKMNEQKIAFENQFGGGSWKDRHALAKRAMTQPKEVLEWKSLDPDFDKLPEALQDLMGGERFRATTKWTDPYGPYKYTPAETNVASANKSTTSGINGRNGLAKNWSVFDGFNVDGDFIGEGLTSEEEEEYNEYLRSIGQMPTTKDPNIFQRAIGGIRGGINRANEYNRAYNDTTGLNTNYYAGSLHGNIDNAARIGRRNQARVNNLIGNYIAGNNKMTPLGLRNRINFLGTNQQKQTFADAIARKTHSPHANYDYWEGQGVDTADITADVTGMYTDDPSGISFARGGLTQRAPRGSYLNGGLASLWPR